MGRGVRSGLAFMLGAMYLLGVGFYLGGWAMCLLEMAIFELDSPPGIQSLN